MARHRTTKRRKKKTRKLTAKQRRARRLLRLRARRGYRRHRVGLRKRIRKTLDRMRRSGRLKGPQLYGETPPRRAHVTEDGAMFRAAPSRSGFYEFRARLMEGKPRSETAKNDVEARMKFYGMSRAQAEEEVYGYQP